MKNKIFNITSEEYSDIHFDENTKVLVFDPTVIRSWDDFAAYTAKELDFPPEPDDIIPGFDAYDDWITDLSWYPDEMNFAVVFMNFHEFMKDDPDVKKMIMRIFTESVLPFWEEEVLSVMVGGKTREFNVYCVD